MRDSNHCQSILSSIFLQCMKMGKTLAVWIILVMLVSCNGCGLKSDTASISPYPLPPAPRLSSAEYNRLHQICNAWYDSLLNNNAFNGAILIAKEGNVVFEKYKGTGHVGGKDTIDSNTSFHIASVSKTFTAMAVLKLVQDKKIFLDDAFSKYFPAFNYPGVTIRSLLNHRSGLPNYVYFMEKVGWDPNRFVTNQDILHVLVNKKNELEDITTPNTHFTYCNTNYALLALLIEKVSHLPYPAYMKKYVFDPLHMNHSFVYTKTDSSRTIPSYDWKGAKIESNYLDEVYGDKNIYSTPSDMLQWDRLLHTNLFLSTDLLKEAYQPYSNERPGIRNYGLGWRMNLYPNGKKIIYHNGWWHGCNASFIRIIQNDATIIVLGNRFNRNIYKTKLLLPAFDNELTTTSDEE